MLKKLISMSTAIALAAVAATATVEPAQARGGRGVGVGVGVAAGIIGLGILGAAAANARPYGSCYPGPRQCDYAGRRCWYNRFGEYVCGGGEYRCYRPTICP